MDHLHCIFDLDGTLTNPAEGITKSLNDALQKMGAPEREAEALLTYIGPSIRDTFSELLSSKDEAVVMQAVTFYRERYFTIGFRENFVYDGVDSMLETLAREGRHLYVATMKRQDIAENVLRHFDLLKYMDAVYGCDLGVTKVEVLRLLCAERGIRGRACIMIGDRNQDITAARQNGMFSLGALWGFAQPGELARAECNALAASPREIHSIVQTIEAQQTTKRPD